VKELAPAAAEFADATPDLTTTFQVLNAFLNGLAYNPPGKSEGYLFYLTWLNHVANSVLSAQDAHGSIRRGSLVISCDNLASLNGIKRSPAPTQAAVRLLAMLVNVPNYSFLNPGPYCTRADLASGGTDN
jgi:phospholipid/cholesterol/gamma-HCH transport system substrate-binding protein